MCMSTKTQTPAAPPPPPPVLDQAAPQVATPTQAESLKRRRTGVSQYRSNMTIGGATPTGGDAAVSNSGVKATM